MSTQYAIPDIGIYGVEIDTYSIQVAQVEPVIPSCGASSPPLAYPPSMHSLCSDPLPPPPQPVCPPPQPPPPVCPPPSPPPCGGPVPAYVPPPVVAVPPKHHEKTPWTACTPLMVYIVLVIIWLLFTIFAPNNNSTKIFTIVSGLLWAVLWGALILMLCRRGHMGWAWFLALFSLILWAVALVFIFIGWLFK